MEPDISTNNQNNPKQDNQFTTRKVETPILGASFGDRLRQNVQAPQQAQTGFKSFYAANKIYFWAIFAGVIIIAALSYFAFFRKQSAAPSGGANVSVSIQAPSGIPSGSDALYKIVIQNNDSQKLVNLQLEMVYPDGVAYVSSTPGAQNPAGTLFTVPDLSPGQNAAILIKAETSGNVGAMENLVARLHYHYSNFNSEFIKEQDFSINVIASDVPMQITGPATSNNDGTATYTLTYQNNSQSDINNAEIELNYPSGFTFASASPTPPNLGASGWSVPALPQGSTGTISITGSFNAAPGQSETFTASFLVLAQDGSYYTQASATYTTQIATEPLVVSQQLQDQSQNGVVDPGDTVSIIINYQNAGTVAATGVNIVENLNSKAIDPSSIRAEGGQISGTTILWNAASLAGLSSLSPSGSGTLLVSFNILNPAVRDASTNLVVDSQVKINANEYPTYFSGNDLSLKVSSPSAISASVSYLSGPNPPVAGQSTTYQVALSLTNATNDFSNTVVTAYVPLGPNGFDANSVGEGERTNVSFDSSTGQLTWQVSALPAHTGQFTAARTLQFNVSLNPSQSEVGQTPVLLKTIVMSATDNFTGQAVHDQAGDLTTQNAAGQNGSGAVEQ